MQYFKCLNTACQKLSDVLHAEETPRSGERIYVCSHCQTRHLATQDPTPPGSPALFTVVRVVNDA